MSDSLIKGVDLANYLSTKPGERQLSRSPLGVSLQRNGSLEEE